MNHMPKMPLLEGVYGGASIEASHLGKLLFSKGITDIMGSGSLFHAVDAALAPAYPGRGEMLVGNSNVCFCLGRR